MCQRAAESPDVVNRPVGADGETARVGQCKCTIVERQAARRCVAVLPSEAHNYVLSTAVPYLH